MRYITRPSSIDYSVFDRQKEKTFMDGLTIEQAEELAFKMNQQVNGSIITSLEEYRETQDYLQALKDPEMFETRELYAFDIDFLEDKVTAHLEQVIKSAMDEITDELALLELTDDKYNQLAKNIQSIIENRITDDLPDKVTENINDLNEDLSFVDDIKDVFEALETLLEKESKQ